MDQSRRKKAVQRFFRSARVMVCWNSTTACSLANYEVKLARELLAEIYEREPVPAMPAKPGEQWLRLGAIDGSQFGHFQTSPCLILGRDADLFMDAEPI